MEKTAPTIWERIFRRGEGQDQPQESLVDTAVQNTEVQPLDIPQGDPLLNYFLTAPGVVDVNEIKLGSPTLETLRSSGVKLALPLVSQGELIGLLNLGPRLSEQEYSTDDKRLLNNLATQAAPALRVAQLARQQQLEALEQERMRQELRVARIIQQTLLPKEIPSLSGWHLAAHWQPARAVSGDFYDFIQFPDGRLGVVCADVTDKGVPAALVMATTRSLLRGAAEKLESPGEVLARTNELLVPDIPRNMFVTCLYLLFDPDSGEVVFANAGHNLPYKRTQNGIEELRATGMPLGLMSDMEYEEVQCDINPGESLLLFSDGLVESHNPDGEMFGFPRLKQVMAESSNEQGLIELLTTQLEAFTGPDWEQEDDVTFVVIERSAVVEGSSPSDNGKTGWRTLATFNIPSQQGNERQAMEQVAEVVNDMEWMNSRLEQLKTAVAEATMNAMEHGNKYQADIPVKIQVRANDKSISVMITDRGGQDATIPEETSPDLEAKLAGQQSPRGWGLFLIENMVDEMKIHNQADHHTIELIMNFEGE